MDRKKSLQELSIIPRFHSYKRSKNCDDEKLNQHLKNGWTTEALLDQNRRSFSGDALRNSLVWAFPQAYYSVYAVTLAYFQMSGFTDGHKHSSLIRKFGEEANSGHYPATISCLACGGIKRTRTFKNCMRGALPNRFHFDPLDPRVVDTHIASLLSATRQSDLRDRLKDRKFKTKTGMPKKKFTEIDYEETGKKLGHTSIFSFLYRKRIKSNYQDIDSILASELKAEEVFPRVLLVVDCLNAIHEAYIARAIGGTAYTSLLNSLRSSAAELPKSRFEDIKSYVV